MKNNRNCLVLLLFVSIFVLALSACGSIEKTIVGKWRYRTTLLDGQPSSNQPIANIMIFEFSNDNDVELIQADGQSVKGVYTLSNADKQIEITAGAKSLSWNISIEGDSLTFHMDVFSKINSPAQKEAVMYERVK